MPTAEDAILEAMWPTLAETHGVSIQYRRNGSNLGTAFTAVKGRSNTEIISATQVESAIADDWIVQRSDLATRSIDNPERGDRIVWTDRASVVHTYEVQMPSGDRQWSKVDQFGLLVRIHSKEI